MLLLENYPLVDWSTFLSDYRFYMLIIVCYLYGAVPFGVIISKLFYGQDIRQQGSKNIGATNMTRVFGIGAGTFTLVLDTTKSALAAMIGWYFFPQFYIISVLCGLVAVWGHTCSIFLGFRGGKGVASFLGVLLVIDWRIFLAAAFGWLIAFFISRTSGISAVLTLIILPITIYQYHQNEIFWLLSFFCLYIIGLHKQNILNLLAKKNK